MGPWQPGKMDWQEPHEVQQGEVQSSAPQYDGGCPAVKQLCRKGPGVSGRSPGWTRASKAS